MVKLKYFDGRVLLYQGFNTISILVQTVHEF